MVLHILSAGRLLTAGALALLAAGCGRDTGAPAWRGTLVRDGASVEVRNPAAPVFGEGAARAERLWTTPGPAEDPAASGWNQPIRVALGADELYVLDPMARTVHVVSRAGAPLRRVGRAGQGPGELQSPFGVAFVNGVLAVGDAGGTVDLFAPTGEPSGSMRLGTVATSLVGVEPRGLLVKNFRGEQRLYDVGGTTPPVSVAGFRRRARDAEFACSRVTGAGPEIVRLDCAQPLFQVLAADGTVLRTVRVAREPVPATRDELELYRGTLAADVAQAGDPRDDPRELIESLLRDQDPKRLMRGIRYDAAAGIYALWEQQPQELGNGPARLHLFGRTGVFLATVAFGEPWVDFAIDGSHVYALAEDAETGVARLAAYRLVLSPEVGRMAAETSVAPERS